MKKSELTFAEGFTCGFGEEARAKGAKQKAFDWDKAAEIIKSKFRTHKDLRVEAGLQKDWSCTGDVIFEDGKPTNDGYTYLSSNWAIPTLVLEWDGEEQQEIACFTEESDRFNGDAKWDKDSLKILGIEL